MNVINFTKKKIIALAVLVSVLLLSIVGAIFGFTVKASAETLPSNYTDTLTSMYDAYLTTCGKDPDSQADRADNNNINGFLNDNVTSDGKLNGYALYEQKGSARDMLTDEGVAALREVFGISATDILMNGSTIGGLKKELITGDFKAYKDGYVKVGGETVDSSKDFSIVIMGDQQTAVEYHSAYVAKSYDWIKANASDMNLKAFINVGDIVDDPIFLNWRQPSGDPRMNVNYNPNRLLNGKEQLQFAANQSNKLMNLNIPIAMTLGNHDYDDMAESYRVKDSFNQYFIYNDYAQKSWFGDGVQDTTETMYKDSLYQDLEAAAYNFEAFGTKYMIITLGTYPTTEILDWANGIVAANPEKKVIVSTHAYMDGSQTLDLRQDGQRMWDNFVSKHENIFMLVCGHECTEDGSILKRVDFGENGNPVYQFMINPQKEEFGGAGLFSQLIFREDGSVDVVSFSPYVADVLEKGGYFLDENQFSFDLNITEPDLTDVEAYEESVGNVLVTLNGNYNTEESWLTAMQRDLDADGMDYDDFSLFYGNEILYLPVDNYEGYMKNVYAYSNAAQVGNGFGLEEEADLGYVTTCLYVGDYKYVFSKLNLAVDGYFTSNNGFYSVEVSGDGENFTRALYNNVESGVFGRSFNIDRFASGSKYLYIRVVFSDAVISKLITDYDYSQTVFTKETENIVVDFSNNIDTNYTYVNYSNDTYNGQDIKGAYSSYYAVYSGGILGSGGSGRMTYKSDITFRIDTGDSNRFIKQINPQITLRVKDPTIDAFGHEFQEADTENYLRFSMSFDNGKTFKAVSDKDDFRFADIDFGTGDDKVEYKTVKNVATYVDGEGVYEGKGVVEEMKNGANSLLFRIEYFGAGSSYADCGIQDLDIKIVFSDSLEERTLAEKTFDLNGGVETSDPLNPVKSGYKFVGWYYNGAKADPEDAMFDDGEFTFVAKWKRVEYNITYILNGGKNSRINISSITENEFIVLGAATKEGKAFAGWYDKDGNKMTKLEGSKISDDLVLYAVYTDYVDNNGGCSGNFNAIYLALVLIPVACVLIFVRAKKHGN